MDAQLPWKKNLKVAQHLGWLLLERSRAVIRNSPIIARSRARIIACPPPTNTYLTSTSHRNDAILYSRFPLRLNIAYCVVFTETVSTHCVSGIPGMSGNYAHAPPRLGSRLDYIECTRRIFHTAGNEIRDRLLLAR